MDLSSSVVLRRIGEMFGGEGLPSNVVIEAKDPFLALAFTMGVSAPVVAQLEKFLPDGWRCLPASTSLVVPKFQELGTAFALLPPGVTVGSKVKIVDKAIPGMHLVVVGRTVKPVWEVVVLEPADEDMQLLNGALTYEKVCAELYLQRESDRDRAVLARVAAALQTVVADKPRMTAEEALKVHIDANWPAIKEAWQNVGKPRQPDDAPAAPDEPQPTEPGLSDIAAARHWIKLIEIVVKLDDKKEPVHGSTDRDAIAQAYGWAHMACRVLRLNYAEVLAQAEAVAEKENTP